MKRKLMHAKYSFEWDASCIGLLFAYIFAEGLCKAPCNKHY